MSTETLPLPAVATQAESPSAPPQSVAVGYGITAGDVAARLGVPASRIVLRPIPGTATREDWIRCVETKSPLCELIDGTLVEKAMGASESRWASVLIGLLEQAEARLGELRGTDELIYEIISGDGPVDSGENGRLPDVSVIDAAAWDVAARKPAAPTPILAVEVLSPSNTKAEMNQKRTEYFAAGVQELWVLDPTLRQVEVWTAVDTMTLIPPQEAIDASRCFPGLMIPVESWLSRRLSRDAKTLLEPMTA